MAGIGEKTKIATGEATTPPGVVPTALSSQQSQALGKARVDLSAVQAAVERSERATDNTVYPDSQEKSGPAGSTPGGGGSSGASPSMPPIPSAVTTQQSQALSKARVDLGAMASAIQGAMLQPPASPTNARAGEKDLTAVARDEGTLAQTRLQRGADTRGKSRDVVPSTPVFDAYVAELRRSAEEPFPEVADVPPGEPASSAPTRPEAAPPGAVDTADRTAPTQRRASSKPDYVAAPIRVGPPRRAGAVAPLGGGAAQGAASLGVPAPGGSAALGGDRAIVGSIDALPAPMADRVRDAEPCDPRERAERLLLEARDLRGAAAAATESLQLARAHRAEAEARHLEALAMRATVEAQAVADAEAVLHMQAQREAALETMLASRAASLDPDGLLSDPRRVGRATRA